MPESANDGIGSSKRQAAGDKTDGIDGVPDGSALAIRDDCVEINTYQTPTNSMGTSIENAFLKALDCFQPVSSTLVYIL